MNFIFGLYSIACGSCCIFVDAFVIAISIACDFDLYELVK